SRYPMLQASAILKNTDLQIEPEFEARLNELLEVCRERLPTTDEDLIRRAFKLGNWAHRNDRRISVVCYITHPIEVATIAAHDRFFDDISVAAALLHHTFEDPEFSLHCVREGFFDELDNVVDGLTKISDVFASRELGQAENVRKLMLSMATDIRVILVKYADRLHNMRTLSSLPKQKQFKIASETLDLFAPLAHRFGLHAIKNELEDLSLKVLDPEEYYGIVQGLRASKQERDAYIRSFIEPLQARLEEDGFEFEIYGRSKNIYSIFRKMRRQNKPLEEIYDLFALRIVLKSTGKKGKEDCWRVYSIVTDLYKPLPERFRDFISVPKSNGYQSLHTTVLGPEGRRVEVQIRTAEMHEIAERGVAAHWKYKEGLSEQDEEMEQFLAWVRDLIENPRPEQATEFVKEFRLNLYDEEIYVFTPKGELMTLPNNATPVDFAFQVHTEVGMHCIGAKVNGKMVPLSYKLKSGDQVEIITSKKQTPNKDWMKFVVTHNARSRIRHWINEKRRRAVELRRDVLEKKVQKAGLELDEQEIARRASKLKFPNPQQMYYEIGVGLYDAQDFVEFVKGGPEEKRADGAEPDEEEALRLQYENFIDTAQASAQPALKIDG